MWIVDRYLLRQFTQVFFICWFSLTGLFVVFDGFTNLDEFIRFCEARELNLLSVMGQFYTYRSLAVFDQLSPVLAMIAAMFTMTWIQRHNELTALMAAGISRRRVVQPVIGAAIAISCVALASRELVIPQCREELIRIPQDLGGDNPQPLRPQDDYETGIVFRGQQTFANHKQIHTPQFHLPIAIDAKERKIVARDCFYQPAEGEHPAGYLFQDVSSPLELLQEPSLKFNDRVVVFTPHDHSDWLKPRECFVASGVTFEQLTGGQSWRKFSSTPELIAGLKNPSIYLGGSVRVAVHARLVQPFLDVTLLFLGLPLVLNRENRNMFVAIGLAVLLVTGFMSMGLASQYFGATGLLSPSLGAWLPLLIFVPLAHYMYDRVER